MTRPHGVILDALLQGEDVELGGVGPQSRSRTHRPAMLPAWRPSRRLEAAPGPRLPRHRRYDARIGAFAALDTRNCHGPVSARLVWGRTGPGEPSRGNDG